MIAAQQSLARSSVGLGAQSVAHQRKAAGSVRVASARLIARAGLESEQASAAPKRTRVLPLIAELLDVTTQTAILETYAGRTAMLGVFVAAGLELLLPHQPLFVADASRLQALAGFAAALLAASAALAAAPKARRAGSALLLEPVLASLTSQSRSVGSVSRKYSVDAAVDYIFDTSFKTGQDSLMRFFPLEAEAEEAVLVPAPEQPRAASPGPLSSRVRDSEIDSI